MTLTLDRSKTSSWWIVLLLVVMVCLPSTLHAGGGQMTLRINDTMAEAGDMAAIVLRTYAPRGISQGQICFRSASAARTQDGTGGPFATLEEVIVFSEDGDAEVIETFDDGTQTTLIEFESLSATINWADGPLAVLFFRLHATLSPGQEFELELDLADTFVFDADGQPISLVPRSGALEIRAPGDPYELSAEGDDVGPGEVAVLGVETSELFEIGSGQVVLRYDPDLAGGLPTVVMDPRHGSASFNVDDSVPGRVWVDFVSADASLNQVPGQLISVHLPIATDAPIGNQSLVSLDPLLTQLQDPQGMAIQLALANDVLEIVEGGLIFADGFETGLAPWIVVQ